VKLESMIEQSPEDADRVLGAGDLAGADGVSLDIAGRLSRPPQRLAFDRRQSIVAALTSLRMARDNARQVREQLSNEVWEHLNRLYLRLRRSRWIRSGCIARAAVSRGAGRHAALEGVTYSTLRHGEGWYFLELGRISNARSLSAGCSTSISAGRRDAAPPPPPKYFDWLVLLKFCTAFEPYCKLYTAAIRPQNDRGVSAVRSGVSAFGQIRGRPGARCAGARGAGRAAGSGAPRCERLAGRLKAASISARSTN
jgi:uncharacterized alpha-E superfamily protein